MAAKDLQMIQNGDSKGFRWPVTITDPAGTVYPAPAANPIYGFTTDIEQVIDVETGQAVGGRFVGLAITIGQLEDAGITILPHGVAAKDLKPWLVAFDDINGNSFTFKVTSSRPDRAIGNLLLNLDFYKPAP